MTIFVDEGKNTLTHIYAMCTTTKKLLAHRQLKHQQQQKQKLHTPPLYLYTYKFVNERRNFQKSVAGT